MLGSDRLQLINSNGQSEAAVTGSYRDMTALARRVAVLDSSGTVSLLNHKLEPAGSVEQITAERLVSFGAYVFALSSVQQSVELIDLNAPQLIQKVAQWTMPLSQWNSTAVIAAGKLFTGTSSGEVFDIVSGVSHQLVYDTAIAGEPAPG